MKTKVETIDLTPSWQAVAKIILLGLQQDGEGEKIAIAELMHMAEVADHALELDKDRVNPETLADIAYYAGHRRFRTGDSREDAQVVINLAREFDKLHAETEWGIDVDYIAEIDSFAKFELDKLEGQQTEVSFHRLFPTASRFYNEFPDLLFQTAKIEDTEIQGINARYNESTSFDNNGADINYEPDEMDANVYTVYVRINTDNTSTDNPIIAIADFEKFKDAQEFEKLIRSLLKL